MTTQTTDFFGGGGEFPKINPSLEELRSYLSLEVLIIIIPPTKTPQTSHGMFSIYKSLNASLIIITSKIKKNTAVHLSVLISKQS